MDLNCENNLYAKNKKRLRMIIDSFPILANGKYYTAKITTDFDSIAKFQKTKTKK